MPVVSRVLLASALTGLGLGCFDPPSSEGRDPADRAFQFEVLHASACLLSHRAPSDTKRTRIELEVELTSHAAGTVFSPFYAFLMNSRRQVLDPVSPDAKTELASQILQTNQTASGLLYFYVQNATGPLSIGYAAPFPDGSWAERVVTLKETFHDLNLQPCNASGAATH